MPRSKNHVKFTIAGPGEIAAVDNGDPTSFEPFQAGERDAFNGLALVIIRTKAGEPGTIRLRARIRRPRAGGRDAAERGAVGLGLFWDATPLSRVSKDGDAGVADVSRLSDLSNAGGTCVGGASASVIPAFKASRHREPAATAGVAIQIRIPHGQPGLLRYPARAGCLAMTRRTLTLMFP